MGGFNRCLGFYLTPTCFTLGFLPAPEGVKNSLTPFNCFTVPTRIRSQDSVWSYTRPSKLTGIDGRNAMLIIANAIANKEKKCARGYFRPSRRPCWLVQKGTASPACAGVLCCLNLTFNWPWGKRTVSWSLNFTHRVCVCIHTREKEKSTTKYPLGKPAL